MSQKLSTGFRYAVVGMGFIYPRHKQAIEATGGQVIMTCDIDPSKGADFTDWAEMMHHPDFKKVDAVVVLTPNYLHVPISLMARELGKEVLCEKPMSINGVLPLDAFGVLQLRHHPEIKKRHGHKIKSIYVEAKMFRDEQYFNSWKGNPVKSGGILYNLGVHYLDLITYLLGEDYIIKQVNIQEKIASGKLKFEEAEAEFHIEIVDDRNKQGRKILIDGEEITLSNQDNLSYEDLHTEVYKQMLKDIDDECYGAEMECEPALTLIQALYASV